MGDITRLIPVPVHRNTLFVADATEPLVPLRPICEALGVSWQPQHAKVTTHPTFAPCVTMIVTQGPVQRRDMLCMPTFLLPGWLMTINPNKVHPRHRDALVAFQREASRLLYEAWWSARHGLPLLAGKPVGNLLERVEGPPRMADHPAVAQAIGLCMEAGRDIADAFRAARIKQREARKAAARAGLSARELRLLVERQRWQAKRPSNDSPLFDADPSAA
jgi:hypothetical protein